MQKKLFTTKQISFLILILWTLKKNINASIIIYSNETRHFPYLVKDHGAPQAPLFMICDKTISTAIKALLLP